MKYGFIGCGAMASAILRGMKKSGKFEDDSIYVYDIDTEKSKRLESELGVVVCQDEVEVVTNVETLLLAVKPQMMQGVLKKIMYELDKTMLVITIAAGKPISFYEEFLGKTPIVRVMPNINAKVNCAVSGICGNTKADEKNKNTARSIFETVGTVVEISEEQFPAFSALGGASGAFVLTMIDAIATSGVKAGLSRTLSLDVACQVVMGSAKLAAESGEHPCALVNQICSPGGTTIEGVMTLKKLGFETAIHEGIDAIIQKDKKLAE